MNGARLKGGGGAAKKPFANPAVLFQRLDADRDGFLTLAEFRQMAQLRQGLGGPFMKGAMTKGGLPRPKAVDPAREVAVAEAPISAEQTRFFEAKIRPVLATKCASATRPRPRR